ncbi:MAG: hypothetical protein WCJ33_02565 [Pseudomonadota bacterium]
MKDIRKILMLSTILMASYSLSACSQNMSFFAPERTLPDGSKTTFENRHTPILNNDNAGGSKRSVPNENSTGLKNSSVNNAYPANISENTPPQPAVMNSPVVPVTENNVPQLPANNSNNSSKYPVLANVPQTPVIPSKDKIKNDFGVLNQQQTTSEANRKNLMENSSATVMTSPKNGQLVDNPATAGINNNNQIQSQNDLATPPANITDVKSMDITKKPLPEINSKNNELTENTKSDSGFSAWLNNTFSSDKKPQPNSTSSNKIEDVAKQDNTRRVPVENISNSSPQPVVSSVQNTELSKNPEPIVKNPESKKSWFGSLFSSKAKSNSLEKTEEPYIKASTNNESKTIALTPPVVAAPASEVTSNNLPNISQMSERQANRVNLVQPSENITPAAGYGYIGDSRYANTNSSDKTN